MMERKLPWWRRALEFAVGGIVGLFRRNGNGAAKREVGAQEAAAEPETAVVPRPEEEENEIEVQEEESRVNPFSPYSEPVDHECAAPEAEVAAETIAPLVDPFDRTDAISAQEFVAGPSAVAEDLATPATPEPAAKKERPAPTKGVSSRAASEPEALLAGESRAESPTKESALTEVAGHVEFTWSPGSYTVETDLAGALTPETSFPSIEPEIPSAFEETEESAVANPAEPAETTSPDETASIEEVSESLEEANESFAIAAEAQPEEARTPEPETTQGVDATLEEMETPLHENEAAQIGEASPPSAAIAAAVQFAPAPPPPASPQEIAPTLPFTEKPAGRTTAEKVAAALKAREARGEEADQSPFSVLVNQVYDGPLDLLLDLIRKQDIDIYDIPIAKITAQFLAYVDRLRASDMDVAGDFIYTAALLIHIKSRMLLPRAPAGPDDADDPRRELVERLLEHERFRNAAQMLKEKQMLEAASWTNPGMREFKEDAAAEPEIAADTTDLVRVFSDILERARNRPIINVEEDSVTVGQMIQFLARRLTMEDRPVALRRMLSHTKSERALIAMFLALLELVRLQAILLRQDRQFSEIFIKKNTGFDALMNQGLADARDDWR